MERGTTITWLRAAGAVVAAAAGISCGAGIHGDEGWYYVSGSIDSSGGQLVLREGTLLVARNCVEEAVPITLRRQDRIDHSGAIGPVFTIEVPLPTTFVNDPQINIATSAAVAGSASSTIGYIVNTQAGPQWIPDSPPFPPECPEGTVCGPVQTGSFRNPASDADPSRVVQFAIVKKCGSLGECPSKQACNSGACQACPTGAECNR
jgi:hypothetical protein